MQVQELTTLSIRPFTAEDYAAIAQLHRVNFPEFNMDVAEWQFDDNLRPAHCRLGRWVAEWHMAYGLIIIGTRDPQSLRARVEHYEIPA